MNYLKELLEIDNRRNYRNASLWKLICSYLIKHTKIKERLCPLMKNIQAQSGFSLIEKSYNDW